MSSGRDLTSGRPTAFAIAVFIPERRSTHVPTPGGDAILVVDDDTDAGSTMRGLLERLLPGTTVRSARGADDALALLDSQPFAAVLADYRMPGKDGLEFLRAVRRDHPAVKRILMTGDPDPGLAVRAAAEAETIRVFIKPVDVEAMARVLRYYLRG